MADLLDLLDDWTDAPEWLPLYKPFGVTLASVMMGDRCRDCGARASYNQGGAAEAGIYMVCDECAQIDGCWVNDHELLIGPHRSGGLNLAARCSCGWDIAAHHPDGDGGYVPWTPEELADIMANHLRPKHSSHWGTYPHEIADCERLHKERERRRARYRAKHPDHADGSLHG